MKKKIIVSLCALLIIPSFLCAKVAIKKVEYLKGDGFVQLYFKTQQIIPIPDLFYPVEDNYKFIVMRINDVKFEQNKKMYAFNSPVIDNINVKDNGKFLDVEIKLKENVNYRVFTNQNGLYIEFPDLKVKKPVVRAQLKKTPAVKTSVPKQTFTRKKEVFQNNRATTGSNGSRAIIRSIQLAGKDKDHIAFELKLSKKASYKVIPIPESPARLAIDLNNTWSKKIDKKINALNVKKIRGAFNNSDNFRIVFDLAYLKHYDVAMNENTMTISFSDRKMDLPVVPATQVLAKNTPPPAVSKKTPVTTTKVREKPLKIQAKPKSKPAQKKYNKKTLSADGKSSITILSDNSNNDGVTLKGGEFFTAEKSKAFGEDEETSQRTVRKEKAPTFLDEIDDGDERKYTGTPISFQFHDMDIRNILMMFSKLANLSIVIDPEVRGRVTCRMESIPWDQALYYFLRTNKLDMVREGRLLRIATVKKLAEEAAARLVLRTAREMEGEINIYTRPLSYAQAKTVVTLLSKHLSPRGKIDVDDRSNTLFITEIPDRIKDLDKLLKTIDVPNPQVSIEARIIETNSNFARNLGIQWGWHAAAHPAYGNQTTLKFPHSAVLDGGQIFNQQNPGVVGALGGYAINLPASGRTSGVGVSLANVSGTLNLDLALSAMETSGKGRIISSPKATTQNNIEAHIIQGRQIPVQVVRNRTVTVQFFSAALELRVIPQITARGTIILDIDLQNNRADFANPVNGIPPIIRQSVTTTVETSNGGTIVIGGVHQIEDAESSEMVPFLNKIPLLGKLFKNSSRRADQKELLVFISPTIIR